MADWETWVTIVVLVGATALARSTFWLVGHHITIPKRVQEMLRYAPACALAAIVAPDLLMTPAGTVDLAFDNSKLIAAIAATGYYLLRRNMFEMIIFGMLCFTGLRIWLE